MNQEKLIIEDKRSIVIVLLIVTILSNILFYFNGHVFNIRTIIEVKVINIVVGVGTLVMWKYIFRYTKVVAKEVDIKRIRHEMLFLKFIHVVIIVYIFAVCMLIKDLDVTMSAIIMEMEYLQIYLLTRYKKSLRLSDVQLKWNKAWKIRDYSDEDSNIFWRIKIWSGDIKKVTFKERVKRFNLLGSFIFLGLCALGIYDLIFIALILFLLGNLLGHPLLYLIDMCFGLFIEMNGMCIGKIKKEISKKNDLDAGGGLAVSLDNKRYYYYAVYITDFKKKREIKMLLKECDFIEEGKEYTVIHGLLSKRVIKVNGVNVEFLG